MMAPVMTEECIVIKYRLNCSCTLCSTAPHAYTLLHISITLTEQNYSPGTHRHPHIAN